MVQEKAQVQKQSRKDESESADQEQQQVNTLSDDVDELLEEIDSVLEENAEEWVRSFIQKGGEASTLKRWVSDILKAWTIMTHGHALSVAQV